MNMPFRCTSRLIVAIALAFIIPTLVASTLASASGIAPSDSFKLAMGPMSAAQRNQNNSAAEAAPAEPRIVPTYRPRRHYSHHWPRHRHAHHVSPQAHWFKQSRTNSLPGAKPAVEITQSRLVPLG